MKKRTIEELSKRADELYFQSEKESRDFYNKNILGSKDELSIVLKIHLYLEFNMDKLLSLAIPAPKEILKMKFSDKLKILESINFHPIDENIIKKIKVVNTIRNKFSHKLDYKLTNEDILEISKKPNDTGQSPTQWFLKEAAHLRGFMDAAVHITTLFPFLMNSLRNKELFKDDKKFNYKAIFETYKNDGVIEILEKMKR